MGTTLNGTTPQNTYPSLIKVGDNGAVDATLQRLSDGEGNDLPLEVSSTAVNFTGTVTQNGNPISTPPSGVSGSIQFSDGSAFASDADNLFYDDTNNRLGVGINAPTARLQVRGVGTSASTIAFRVENSAGTAIMTVADNGGVNIGSGNVTSISGTLQNGGGPIQALAFASAGNPFSFGTATIYGITGTAPNVTSGQRDGFRGQFTFAPTSGTAVLNVFNASPTINQTGGANGITRGLFISPTLTAAADFRAIETSAGGAYINTSSVNASAILQADSTTKGFLPPRMTTTQKNAIASPAAGLVVYDTTLNKLCVYTTAWETITSL